MEIEDELHRCCVLIEERLGWGSSSSWATHDYELLSQKIQEVTEVNLSIATLKRIWGKIRYDSKPTITTLNTLAQYLGFENWRSFTQTHAVGVNGQAHAINGQSAILPKAFAKKLGTRNYVVISALLLAAAAGVYWKVYQKEIHPTINPALYSFSSKQVLGEGVPNTVIFDYDASAASPRIAE